MDYDAANDYIKRRVTVATTLSSQGIDAAIPEKVRMQCFFSARIAESRVLRVLRRVSNAHGRGDLSLTEARTLLKRWLDREHPGQYDLDDNRMTNIASTMRLDLILRQNAAMAAAVGRYQVSRDPDVEERWPCWRYIAGPNPRPDHAALDGRVYRKDDPIWRRCYPPWEFNCNCDVEDCDDPPETSTGHIPEAPDSGYKFDPTEAFGVVDLEQYEPDFKAIVSERIKAIPAPALAVTPQKMSIPAGIPVGNALMVVASDKTVRADIEHAIEVINSVHGDGSLMQTPISGRAPGGGALGCFTRWFSSGRVAKTEINIAKSGTSRDLTTIHEIGHLIDAFGLGNGLKTGAEVQTTPEVKMWFDAVQKSKLYAQLKKGTDSHSKYLQNPKELWARSYAQYIARTSKDPKLLSELDKRINCEYNKMYHAEWDDDDFAEIKQSIDKLFRAKGWIHDSV